MKRWILLILALLLAAIPLLPLTGCGASAGESRSEAVSDSELPAVTSELQMYVFSAGKADAMLLTTEHGTVLVDCGEKGFGQEILSYLEAQGIDKIDYLIITHFDQDHVGGAAKVINNISVGTVLQNNSPKDSEEYEKYLKAVTNAGIAPVTVQDSYEFTLDGVLYSVDAPDKSDHMSDDSNNASLVVSVYHGTNSMLLTGDAQTERLEELLESGIGAFDLLKVPHHGREDELMDELVAAVQPKYAVITSSDEEPEDQQTLAVLEEANVEVFLTRVSPVIVRSDGKTMTVQYESA